MSKELNRIIDAIGGKIHDDDIELLWDVFKDGDVDRREFDRLKKRGIGILLEMLWRVDGHRVKKWFNGIKARWNARPIVIKRKAKRAAK